MRHNKKINHLGRQAGHRKALMSNMASSLILHKRIETTVAKAKALRKFVEPLITKSKEDTTHSRRVVFSYLKDKYAVTELFREVAPRVADRPGGYTRILHTGFRLGDGSEMCIIELVDFNETYKAGAAPEAKARTRRSRGGAAKKAAAPVAEETVGAEAANWESITGNRITDDLQNKTKTRVRSRIGGNRVLELLPFTVSDMPGLAGERTGWILRDITQEVSLEAVKENIVGVVAHELKTPLTLLQLQVRDLTRTIEHGQMPSINDVRDLSDETIHLGQLVDDLLDVSRIRAGAMKLNVRVVHVASLIDRAEKLAAARYPMKVSRHIDMDAELFCVDPDRLTQVFVNLFNNAARYKKPTQEVALIDVSTRIDGQ